MKFIDTIKNIWNITELKDRILFTLAMLLVYRFGAQISIPGIDPVVIAGMEATTMEDGILGLLNAFTGGAFAQASVFALGIMPYISASIVVQLMGIAIPYLQKLQKEGASGQKKITQITRWLTIAICLVQAPGYLASVQPMFGIPAEAFTMGQGPVFFFTGTIVLITGCIFAMWLGEKITDKGIGNGISLLITVGIIANMPQSFVQNAESRLAGNGGFMLILIELIIWLLTILACVYLVKAVRRVIVQYARRTASGSYEKNISGSRQFLPLKLNASGVMPIIFAQALMFLPGLIGGQFSDSSVGGWINTNFQDMFGLWYNVLFGILIIIFTYFYTAITIPTSKMADDLKRSGGFIPGVRPGTETDSFLDKIMSHITLPGSVFLAIIAVLPAFAVYFLNVQQGWALFFGGTSLLIMVGVAIDTIQQVNSYLLNRHYDGLMKAGKNRKTGT
ncbi:preprotein translocase subunit SecY [Flavobacteriaceae bacterium]|nr:preprotein translocase subunit SecY [Flavobacteriaceae bacterium]